MKLSVAPRTLAKYDVSRAKWRHPIAIRESLKIKPYGVEARRLIVSSIAQAAITKHSYNQFNLPKFWGTGKRVSADGTKWDIYEQNLLAEYPIR